MRRYLTLFMVLVTFAIAGCSTRDTPRESSGMRTPSGSQIDDRLPDFRPMPSSQTGANAMPTATGRANVTPYYQDAQRSAANLKPVKIGFLVPLSGPQAPLGQAMLNAAQLALFDMKASNITLVPRDTTSNATNAAREALSEGAEIILGPLFAQDVKAVSPIARANNVPVIAFSTDWTAATDNTYIMGFLPFGQVSRVVDYAAKRGARNFSALIPETPYGIAVNGSLRNTLKGQNLPTPFSFVFNNATGVEAPIQQLAKARGIDALLLPIGGAQLAQISNLLRQNDLNLGQMRLIGTGLWDDSSQASSIIPGAWFAAPDPKLRISFERQYQSTYGQPAPRLASLAYDATALAATLAAKGLSQKGAPAFTRADFTNPSGFAGLDGVFRFRGDGLAERGLAILELRPNGSVVVDPAPTRF